MPLYSCPRCRYTSHIKTYLRKHFLRKKPCRQLHKHVTIEQCFNEVLGINISNESKMTPNESKMNPNESKMTPNESKMNPNESKMTPNESKMTPTESKMNPNESKMNPNESKPKYECKHCNKCYSTNSNLHKHLKKCKLRFVLIGGEYKDPKDLIIENLLNEKKSLTKSIGKLLDRVGNVTNNITNNNNQQQNIYINNHGNENLDYINQQYLNNLIKSPYGALPKLLKNIHFHPEHPENYNVIITNKKLKYAKVWDGVKWKLQDKTEIIKNMVDKGFNIIEGQFLTNCKDLESQKNKNYTQFQKLYDNGDKKLHKELEKDTEMLILNNS